MRFQDRIAGEFQPPTPWVGRLSEAPILFIGSNPNISGTEHYPAAVALVLSGKVRLRPFVERRPLSSINATFADLHAHRVRARVVLVP